MTEKTLGQIARDSHETFKNMCPTDAQIMDNFIPNSWEAIAQVVVDTHEARKWQPIESAPKDANTLLLYRVSGNVHWVGYWCTDFKGWRLVGSNITVDATHWQQLSPPKQGD
jgi:hypothetical protein